MLRRSPGAAAQRPGSPPLPVFVRFRPRCHHSWRAEACALRNACFDEDRRQFRGRPMPDRYPTITRGGGMLDLAEAEDETRVVVRCQQRGGAAHGSSGTTLTISVRSLAGSRAKGNLQRAARSLSGVLYSRSSLARWIVKPVWTPDSECSLRPSFSSTLTGRRHR